MRSMAFSGFWSKTPNFDLISFALEPEGSVICYSNVWAFKGLQRPPTLRCWELILNQLSNSTYLKSSYSTIKTNFPANHHNKNVVLNTTAAGF